MTPAPSPDEWHGAAAGVDNLWLSTPRPCRSRPSNEEGAQAYRQDTASPNQTRTDIPNLNQILTQLVVEFVNKGLRQWCTSPLNLVATYLCTLPLPGRFYAGKLKTGWASDIRCGG